MTAPAQHHYVGREPLSLIEDAETLVLSLLWWQAVLAGKSSFFIGKKEGR